MFVVENTKAVDKWRKMLSMIPPVWSESLLSKLRKAVPWAWNSVFMKNEKCIPFSTCLKVEVQGQNVCSFKKILPQILKLPGRNLNQSTPLFSMSALHSFCSANTQPYLPLSPLPDRHKKWSHNSIFSLFCQLPAHDQRTFFWGKPV